MRLRQADPLLRGTRVLLTAIMIFSAATGIVLALGIPVVWLASSRIDAGGHPLGPDGLVAISAMLAIGAVFSALSYLSLRHLIGIVDSVAEGSPFVADNARRLRGMAWLLLAMTVLTWLINPLVAWILNIFPNAPFEVTFSFGWLIASLLLFILARVFDQGTKLAEDVEGTV